MVLSKNPTVCRTGVYCLQGYFDGKLAPVMKQVRDDLTHKQLEEKADTEQFGRSALLLPIRMPTTPSLFYKANRQMEQQNHGGLSGDVQPEDMEGQKHREGFGSSCWRVAQCRGEGIGRNKYDALSKACGEDLAYAYVAQRMEDLMIGKVRQGQYTKSTMDYILRKGCTKQHLGTARRTDEVPIDGRDRSSWRESL